MIEFLNRIFGRHTSGATAKERLRLVLMSDHLSLAPEMIESMKRDLVDVISRYVEVDRSKIDVHFENQDNALAMLANIPITGVNRNSGGNGDGGGNNGNGNGTHEAKAADATCHGELVEPQASIVEPTAPKPQTAHHGSRKRRKKSGGGGHQSSGARAPAT
jgi:cell division topological specificity factor